MADADFDDASLILLPLFGIRAASRRRAMLEAEWPRRERRLASARPGSTRRGSNNEAVAQITR